MQVEILVSGWLLSVPVRLTSVRFTSVHGELRFKGELTGVGSRLTELRLIAIRFDSQLNFHCRKHILPSIKYFSQLTYEVILCLIAMKGCYAYSVNS